MSKEKTLKNEIVKIGRKLYQARLFAGHAGNLSARLDKGHILISATGSCLGELKDKDIIKANINGKSAVENKLVSSEFPLHRFIYKNFPVEKVIHCHPPLTNAYFAVYVSLKELTLETKFYLGNIPVVNLNTPTITRPERVAGALKKNKLVVIKNHGVVAMGKNFKEALALIETLENSVKVAAVARLFKKDILDDLDTRLKKDLI
jgi:L-fuculose-phosphate aldolase